MKHTECTTSTIDLHTCDLLAIRDILVMFLKGESLEKDVSDAIKPSLIGLTHQALDKVKEALSNDEGFVATVAKQLAEKRAKDEWPSLIS